MRKLVVVLAAIAAVVVLGCCGAEPSEELQVRWANAACAEHEGVESTDTIELEGHEEVISTSALCQDGSNWIQEYNGADADNEFESPEEVRERQRGEPSE